MNREMRKINCFGKCFTLHEYIKLNVVANRGAESCIYKSNMIDLCHESGMWKKRN